MKFYQACYGKPSNNWELLNVSKDTPSYMIPFFENIGNGCTPQNIGVDVPCDINGNPICLYELISDENIICVLHAKYGERDNFGRPKMFAHGFMFEAEDIYKDPSYILSISKKNYHFSKHDTSNIPNELIFDKKLDIQNAIKISGLLDKRKWSKLIACIYLVLESSTDFPLYIRYDGELETMKATIFCVLSALPISLRYQLSFSNTNSFSYAKFRRVMFVDKIPNDVNYFDLITGETNLNDKFQDIKQYKDRYPTLYRFFNDTFDGFSLYCEKLNKNIEMLSKAYNSGLDDVNIAHELTVDIESINLKNDSELNKYLHEILVKFPVQNRAADEYILKVLSLFENRMIIPIDNVMKRLEFRVDKTYCTELVDVYKRLRIRILLTNDRDGIIRFLHEQHLKGLTIFSEWYDIIIKMPKGKELVKYFYFKLFESVRNFNDFKKFKHEFDNYLETEYDCIIAFKNKIISIANFELNRLNLNADNVSKIFSEVNIFTNEIFGNNYYNKEIIKNILIDFWKNYKYSSFSFDKTYINNMKNLKDSYIKQEELSLNLTNINNLIEIYDAVIRFNSDCGKLENLLIRFATQNSLNNSDKKDIYIAIQNFVLNKLYNTDEIDNFYMWVNLARLQLDDYNPLLSMLQWDLPIICDSNYFACAFNYSTRMQKDANRILNYFNDLIIQRDIYNIDNDLVRTIKKNIKLIEDFIKESYKEKKARDREERKNINISKYSLNFENIAYGEHYRKDSKQETKKSGILNFFNVKKK